MKIFDPNAAAAENSGIFGLPYDEPHPEKDAQVVYLPIPWEVTTSYGKGTSRGPEAILEASRQVDLFDGDVEKPYEAGLYLLPQMDEVKAWNEKGVEIAEKIHSTTGSEKESRIQEWVAEINRLGDLLNQKVFQETQRLLNAGKWVGIIGGDHSVPFGALQAVAERHPSFGILHFDAHSDTRRAYEGFTWSHASIMYNVLEKIPAVEKLVQVGIRDFCEEEIEYTEGLGNRVHTFFDSDLARRKFEGDTWAKISQDIVSHLPEKVWISFDIDGLDPRYCPHTGTPVPGGLEFSEAQHLLRTLVKSGRKIIGFDLNEVSPNLQNPEDEWDANVGARMLYKLTAWLLASQSAAKLRS